jgi:hypothetical protein
MPQPESSEVERTIQDLTANADSLLAPATKKSEPADYDNDEKRLLNDEKQATIVAQQQDNEDKRANRALREKYAGKVYWYLCAYSIACAGFLMLSGFKVLGFNLSDSVLMIVTGSTAASAIGLVGFVVNGLFRPNKDKT